MKLRLAQSFLIVLLMFFSACNLNLKSQTPLKTDEIRMLKIGKTTKAEIEEKYGKPQKDFLSDNTYSACYLGDDGSFGSAWRLMLVAYDQKDTLIKLNFDDEIAKRQCKEVVPANRYTMGSSGNFDATSCTVKGKQLYGKIKQVDNFEDIKVQIVPAFPDLKVQVVNSFPDVCGKWQFVDNFEDIKIRLVDRDADIKIQYVNAFPGPG
jgi:hypothetical protein